MAWETSSLQALGTTRSSNGRPELQKAWSWPVRLDRAALRIPGRNVCAESWNRSNQVFVAVYLHLFTITFLGGSEFGREFKLCEVRSRLYRRRILQLPENGDMFSIFGGRMRSTRCTLFFHRAAINIFNFRTRKHNCNLRIFCFARLLFALERILLSFSPLSGSPKSPGTLR